MLAAHVKMCYASRGPGFWWPFFWRSPQAPTIKGARGTVAIKGIFDNHVHALQVYDWCTKRQCRLEVEVAWLLHVVNKILRQ